MTLELGIIHNIQPDLFPENICGMFETAGEYAHYIENRWRSG